ncbi:putative F-box/LRR-repeat protein 2 [Ditylenchus destructor]|uniref:F-box/LRR-repeat protein 2 n=1 Tax=Ditylenchus destructor TaxID=166010 RepID=A0AAD4QYT6_9BILA|nr:putative F-box/LRR-repeat protein 2 [Ditylenchus destructor]
MASSKLKDYKFECIYCDPKLEMHFSTTKEAMIRHCRIAHDVEEKMDAISNINQLPFVNLAQIFEKLPWQDRLKIEQVCKKWQHVAKNLCWANYKIFDNYKYKDWPDTRAMQIRPFFDRCGRHLRHLTLRKWSPQFVLLFIRMAPNVEHLRFLQVNLDDESLKELAGIVPGLKSFGMENCLPSESKSTDYSLGLIECFKAMTGLEYLYISERNALFSRHSFVQFPSNLKYLELTYVSNVAQILSWVAEGCKNLKGLDLCCDGDENFFHAISQIKSLTYLGLSLALIPPYDVGYGLKELSELRALEVATLDEEIISAIMQHCNKLEHLEIYDYNDVISAEKHAAILRLISLPNLCSFAILADNSKEQRTELVNRLIAKGNLQYIKVRAARTAPFESEILFEILRRCKSIRSVALDFPEIDSDFYSKICQVVDEIDEEYRKQRELTGMTHPIVEVQYNKFRAGNITAPYKWLRFKDQDDVSSTICKKWKFGWLGAGKPDWSIRSIALNFGPINSDFYSKICQVVDEIDEENRKQSALTTMTHPIVEVQYNKYMAGNITTPYKWLRFKDQISSSAICEKWKFGWLGAGKP